MGICNADGLGEASSARASPAPSSKGWIQTALPAPSRMGGEEPGKEGAPVVLGSLAAFAQLGQGGCLLLTRPRLLWRCSVAGVTLWQAETRHQPLIDTLKFS